MNDNNEKLMKDMKIEHTEKLKNAMDAVKNVLGDKSSAIEALLKDDKALSALSSKLSKEDMQKLSKLLDDPAALASLLSSKKGKDGINKFFESK